MKRWVLYLIIGLVGLVTLAYFMISLFSSINFADVWSRGTQPKERQSTAEKLPNVETVPRDLLALRREHQLRPLTELEDGKRTQDVPNGVYGFSMCDVASLRTKPGNTFSLEIHKHHDGIIYYVGYASDEDVAKYLARPKNFHLLTFPHSWEKAPTLFEIPVDFVSKCEARPIGERYLFDLFVISIPELQS